MSHQIPRWCKLTALLANTHPEFNINDRDHRFFAYLRGIAPDVADLNETSLEISVEKDRRETRHYEDKLTKWPQIVLRYDREYGHELKPGNVELLADYVILGLFLEDGNYTFTAEAKLPDGRTLFCFQSQSPLKRP